MHSFESKVFMRQVFGMLETSELRLLKLRIIMGYTQREAAKELGYSQGTVSRMEKKIYDRFGI